MTEEQTLTEEPVANALDNEPDETTDTPEADIGETQTSAAPERTLPPGPFSFGEWVRVRLLGQDVAGQREEQLANLNHAIRRNPASPANYVLRGELYLTVGYEALARVDFERALRLADEEYENDAWGLLSQALRDRAQTGLRRLGD